MRLAQDVPEVLARAKHVPWYELAPKHPTQFQEGSRASVSPNARQCYFDWPAQDGQSVPEEMHPLNAWEPSEI